MSHPILDGQTPWHALPPEEAIKRVACDPATGLTEAEVAERRRIHGPNRLPPPRRRGPVLRFLDQFNNLLIYVLLVAGAMTLVLEHWVDAGVIFGVVVINAVVGFIQEGKAEQALDAIRNMLSPSAVVLRNGRREQIPVEDLVPGDVVLLTAGDKVPADLRLLNSRNLQVQEAVLTGESLPVEKRAAPVSSETPLAERTSMAYSGTLVTAGQGTGVVVETGPRTEIGRISAMLAEVTTLTTPLLQQMTVFGRWLTVAILALAAMTFLFGILVHGYALGEMFLAVVGLAVAAIPEGLPAVMTITLAIGVQRMAGRNAIIRRLPAVETLGSVTVICSDKTGTLTRNEMAVRSLATSARTYSITGVGYAPAGDICDEAGAPVPAGHPVLLELARGAALCTDADLFERDGEWRISGDPTEGALVAMAAKAGQWPGDLRREIPRIDAIPFESEYRFMATLHHDHDGNAFVYLKGAPEVVLMRCARQMNEDGEGPIESSFWHARAEAMASQGERVIALARKAMPVGTHEITFDDVADGLVLVGLFGLLDPPREEAVAAIRRVNDAGIDVKMITGDHAVTAAAIGRQLGLGDSRAVTGSDLEDLDTERLRGVARQTRVFARTAPEHKLKLVQALQADGHVVAMTGDGVNDAPALKRADVGIAMGGKGTEAAKEAAEMVLADDNFASIAAAVEEGRTVYDNLKKAILFILPTNGGEAFIMMAAIVLGLTLPITPKQILWVNMITAVTLALALAFEPPEKGIMSRPPRRRDEPLLSRFLVWRIVFVSALLVVGTMGLFLWLLARTGDVPLARTAAVNALVMGEIVYVWNVRYLHRSVLSREGLFGSRPVLVAVGLVSVFQLVFTYAPPFQVLFETRPLNGLSWAAVLAFGVIVFVLVEAEKAVSGRIRRRSRHKPLRAGE